MKKCKHCKEEKEINCFYDRKDRKDGKQSFCKKCFNSFCMNRWIQRKIDAVKYKGSKCEDCSINYPKYPLCVFDFHHLNPLEKNVEWVKLRLKSWDKIINELDKCILLCANCHRIRHYNNKMAGAAGFEPASSNYALTA